MIRTGSPMYLRPGNLFKDFTIEKKSEGTTARGRVTAGYDPEPNAQLRAVLADADPEERERWHQQQHPITHDNPEEPPRRRRRSSGTRQPVFLHPRSK